MKLLGCKHEIIDTRMYARTTDNMRSQKLPMKTKSSVELKMVTIDDVFSLLILRRRILTLITTVYADGKTMPRNADEKLLYPR